MGCHFLLAGIFLTQGSNPYLLCLLNWQADFFYHCTACVCVCVCVRVRSVVSSSLWPHGLQAARLLCPWNLWTAICQALLSMESSGKKYWSGLPFPTPGDLLDPGIEPESHALASGFFTTVPPGKPLFVHVQTSISDNAIKKQVTKGKV